MIREIDKAVFTGCPMQFLKFQEPTHLDRRGIIESGSFYTPQELVEEVQQMILPYLENKN